MGNTQCEELLLFHSATIGTLFTQSLCSNFCRYGVFHFDSRQSLRICTDELFTHSGKNLKASTGTVIIALLSTSGLTLLVGIKLPEGIPLHVRLCAESQHKEYVKKKSKTLLPWSSVAAEARQRLLENGTYIVQY